MDNLLKDFADLIGHCFNDLELLKIALTHSSHANENRADNLHNERLEFLGDAVLELCISEELFKRFPQSPEGILTRLRSKLVSGSNLARLAKKIGLDKSLFLGKGEEYQGGRERPSLLADAFEAVLGAVFLDAGYQETQKVICKLFENEWPSIDEAQRDKDFKSRLQEYTQRVHKARPVYTVIGNHGPEHSKVFEIRLDLPGGEIVTATGLSLKKAEQSAARQALELLKELPQG